MQARLEANNLWLVAACNSILSRAAGIHNIESALTNLISTGKTRVRGKQRGRKYIRCRIVHGHLCQCMYFQGEHVFQEFSFYFDFRSSKEAIMLSSAVFSQSNSWRWSFQIIRHPGLVRQSNMQDSDLQKVGIYLTHLKSCNKITFNLKFDYISRAILHWSCIEFIVFVFLNQLNV